MKKSFAGSEVILTIGILIAAGVMLVQLRGVFVAEQVLTQEEAVSSFSKDLENIVNQAIAATGDAAYIYYPLLKNYRLSISNNLVSVYDKISKKEAGFSKNIPEIIPNEFEDSENVTVVKKNDKVYIFGPCGGEGKKCFSSIFCCGDTPYCVGDKTFSCSKKCAEEGKKAADSQSCCTGFLNKTSGLCDKPPICPPQSICTGSTDQDVWTDDQGKACCPSERPVCSSKHCCPADKPKWCRNPKSGESRCMTQDEYKNECKPTQVYVVAFVPAKYSDLNAFKSRAEFMKTFTENTLPFRENPDSLVILIDDKNCPVSGELDYSAIKRCGNDLARANGYPGAQLTGGIFGVCVGRDACNDQDLCKGCLGFTQPGQGWFVAGYDTCTIFGCPSKEDSVVSPHEIGHNFRLCEGYCYSGGFSCYAPERSAFGGFCGTSKVEQKFPNQRSATSQRPCGGCGPNVCCLGRILTNDPINSISGGRDIMGPGQNNPNREFACDSYLAFKDVAVSVFGFDLPSVENSEVQSCYNHIQGDTYP